MYSYIIGKIISINKKSITLEHSYIAYVINVGKPNSFVIGKITKIYLHKHCYITNKNSFNDFGVTSICDRFRKEFYYYANKTNYYTDIFNEYMN